MDEQLILELLHNISTQLEVVATKEDIHALSRRLDEVENDYQKLNLFINGNGHPGAKTRIAMLEKGFEDIQKKYAAITDEVVNKITSRMIKIIGVPLLLSIILWVAKVIYDASVHIQLP